MHLTKCCSISVSKLEAWKKRQAWFRRLVLALDQHALKRVLNDADFARIVEGEAQASTPIVARQPLGNVPNRHDPARDRCRTEAGLNSKRKAVLIEDLTGNDEERPSQRPRWLT